MHPFTFLSLFVAGAVAVDPGYMWGYSDGKCGSDSKYNVEIEAAKCQKLTGHKSYSWTPAGQDNIKITVYSDSNCKNRIDHNQLDCIGSYILDKGKPDVYIWVGVHAPQDRGNRDFQRD
ncbi:hypothetical protein N7492_003714 [Penicillium capsulatum]|uniref:Uncharacterized protein n=1 Tax=Penicillium capsulatum TaxID=69766 RepID=A0A9W9LX73_9EURO|nr:hypothetical protein N7492_003714 [Penicillium capsulatum]KAJ6121705.1 hypothetical protein N7512_004170 [Penicillium capsulatum]